MTIDKEKLRQYADLVKERHEVQQKIESLEKQIPKLEAKIRDIEAEGTVKDRVYGGEGGIQGFNIEGVAAPEYDKAIRELAYKKLLCEERKTKLKYLRLRIAETVNEVEDFIASIDDSHIRRIVNLRVVYGMTWDQVAEKVGGGNTFMSVKKAYQRFLDQLL
ncbi:MAG: hypothetical protein IJ680_05770 [Paludibacteraceae bacterium]|nr:hypothetical protein [Paludibacteraceae bacterium]